MPNLDELKRRLRDLVVAGCPPAMVEDRFIGSSNENAKLYERAQAEYAAIPKTVTEGGIEVRTGAGSFGRRSVAGFREMLRQEAS
jgi:hypothetical protein